MTEIIIGCVVVLGIILLAVILINNKFQFAIIKIEEAENSIDTLLKKKAELLERAAPAVIKELKLEDYLTDLSDITPEKCNSFERNDRLKKCYNTYLKTLDENEKLTKSETLSSISDDLESNEVELVGATKFYNDAVVTFNKLIVSFPTSLVGFFKGYKKKAFYNNEKREMYQILNDD